MKIVKRDKNIAEDEKRNAQLRMIEIAKGQKYLESLKGSRVFQKYVVDGILRKNIANLTDIRNIKSESFKDMEEVGRLVLQAKACRAVLEKILSDILNG